MQAITLVPPPSYLAEVPLPALLATSPNPRRFPGSAADRILDALVERGIHARPSLAQVEAERTRRGLRRRISVSAEPALARVVLPMLPGVSPMRAALGLPSASDEGRRNRARIEAALLGVVLDEEVRAA